VATADESVGFVTQNIPLSSVQEFRFGGVLAPISDQLLTPGAVNIITRSGSDQLHGNLFGFYRNGDVLSASLPGGHSNWGRQQYGGNLAAQSFPTSFSFFADVQRNKQDLANPVLVAGPFSSLVPSATTIEEPFREFQTTDRWITTCLRMRAPFNRFSYDRSSDVASVWSGAEPAGVSDEK